jgi:hypothetical protein
MKTFTDLQTPEAVAGRLSRQAQYGLAEFYVIWIEMPNGRVSEFDGESYDHARRLALNWIRPELGAVSASTRKVLANGKTRCIEVFSPEEVTA